MKYMVALCTLVGVGVLNVCAQTSSSANQTVTFGVHRSAPVLVANVQSMSVTVKETGSERSSLLKIAVGSDSRSRVVSELGTTVSQRSFAEYKANIPAANSSGVTSLHSARSVVTLTE